jgi:iturin family lipopeptide synthetase A
MRNYNGTEVAIIGMAGRFPGGNSIDEFWNNLKNGVESVSFFTDKELQESGEERAAIESPAYVKAGSYLQNKQFFDSAFFGKFPNEVAITDPQIRIFQECVWHAMEDAGCNVYEGDRKIGVFAGGSSNPNWVNYAVIANQQNLVDGLSIRYLSNVEFLCSSTSYLFNFRGPSVYLSTACSTSLVAIQKASMSLLLQECNMAIAGGVSVTNKSKRGYYYQEGMIFSKDGHCRAFDKDASGTISGEGVGVVVLKRLKDAIRDGDNIHAIIKGSAINNDGYGKVGYIAPSIEGQCEVILKARKMAKVEPDSITYLEAHGTGTVLGDPIEVEALNLAFGKSDRRYCAIGSVKTNIGHLDVAAGVAGLIKTVLALKHKQIPPSLNFNEPNPNINFGDSPFYVNTQLSNWTNDKYPLRAAVNSFGVGGTNAHVVLEEAPVRTSSSSRPFQVLTVSAKTSSALQRNVVNLRSYLDENKNTNLADVAYTLNTCRLTFEYRKAIVCHNIKDAIEQLSSIADEKAHDTIRTKEERSTTVFMFPGQGSQHAKMCFELFSHEPVFRDQVQRCFDIVQEQYGKDMKAIMFSDVDVKINETEFTQPALFIVEYALSRLLVHWGVQPDVMIGHSIGEYVAACLSEVFTLEDALRLVVKRGELMQQMEKGTMLGISISSEALTPYLEKYNTVSLAAINSPNACVVSGSALSIVEIQEFLERDGFSCKQLQTSHAFHSHQMDAMLAEFVREVEKVTISPQKIPFISNVTGKRAADEDLLRPKYWADQLRYTVKFSEGIDDIMQEKHSVFLEVGPGKTLGSFVGANKNKKEGHRVINLLPKSADFGNSFVQVLAGLGKLWLNGVQPEWKNLYDHEVRQKLSLPGYSFDRIEYPAYVDAEAMIKEMIYDQPLAKKDISEWFYAPTWQLSKSVVKPSTVNFLNVIFLDELGFGEQLKKDIVQKGGEVVVVDKGSAFKHVTKNCFEIDPQNEADFDTLFNEIRSTDLKVRVIFAWAISTPANGPISVDLVRSAMSDGFYSLLNISRGMNSTFGNRSMEIISLTNDLCKVLNHDRVSSEKSPLLGLLKVIPREYESIRCKNIDFTLSDITGAKIMKDIVEEIVSGDDSQIVALRYGTRFVQAIKPVKITQHANSSNPFVSGGVYLITGGIGGMGLTFAKKISENIKSVKLILLGRRLLPEKKKWRQWLQKHKENDPLYNIISTLQDIEERGCTIHYLSVDISDIDALNAGLKKFESEIGNIRGVIHTAGVADDAGIIHRRTKEDNERIISSKIYGTIALQYVLSQHTLDFFVLCSSLASWIAPPGQVGYVAANLFMESIATQINSTQPSVSIGWNQWREVGMAAQEVARTGLSYIENSVSPNEGYELLLQAINTGLPELHISNVDPSVYFEKIAVVESHTELVHTGKTRITKDELEERLHYIWVHFFGKAVIDVNDDFFAIGGDSLKALTLLARIKKEIDIDLSLSSFLNHSSIKDLANHLAERYAHMGVHKNNRSIAIAPKRDHYALSSSQQRIHFLCQLEKSLLTYNMPQVVRLEGSVNIQRLTEAFKHLIQRHESFRTSFHEVNGKIVQKIHDKIDFDLAQITLEDYAVDGIIKNFIRPFDLNEAPLLRAGVVKLTDTEHILMVDMHHIIADGVSQEVLISDFMALYNGAHLPEMRVQYKDYAEWQQDADQRSQMDTQRDFWKQQFAEDVTVLDLPAEHARPAQKSYSGRVKDFVISKSEVEQLRSLMAKEDSTMFMIVLSIFNVLLSKLSGQDDIVIGTPVAGRNHADVEGIIGMFVNTLALRNAPKGDLAFRKFLSSVKDNTVSCFDNQLYPYEELIGELQIRRERARNPLFDVMLVYQNFGQKELDIPGLTLKRYGNVHQVAKFDLTLTVVELDDELHMSFEYATDLFEEQTIDRFIAYFKRISAQVADNADKKLSEIEILSQPERRQLLHGFNDTDTPYPRHKTLVDLFHEQVTNTPNNIAVWCDGRGMTYRELNEKAEKIAVYLQQVEGVKAGDLVGIFLEREESLLPSIFGVLKAGAAYVPLSIYFPSARIQSIIEDANLKVLITRGRHVEILHDDEMLRVIDLDIELKDIEAQATHQLSGKPAGNDLAYVIYTSGSTGNPKGVMVEHHSVVNRLLWMQKQYPLTEHDVLLQKTSLIFDVSVWELFWWSLAGASVCMLSPEEEKNPRKLIEVIEANKITTLHFVPSMLTAFLDEANVSGVERLKSLRQVFASGEALGVDQVNRFGKIIHHPARTRLINLYGPTEATVDVSFHECDFMHENVAIPIGKPIDNIKLYVIDKYNGLCPVGVPGELCIEGVGLARGYLNNEELTSSKFRPNPFCPDGRIYHTGDLVCWLPDGNIKFLGRIDHQVKIRGFRIELNEIERHIVMFPSITDCVVLPRDREEDKYIVAYYVAADEIPIETLRSHLSGQLPYYMVPSFFVHLHAFPLTTSGKVDRKKLPDPTSFALADHEAPTNEIEEKLLAIWSDVLLINRDVISVHSNFFDIGGHSLMATLLVNKIAKEFNLEFNLKDIFDKQSIRAQAEFIALNNWLFSTEISNDGSTEITV